MRFQEPTHENADHGDEQEIKWNAIADSRINNGAEKGVTEIDQIKQQFRIAEAIAPP